LAVVKLEKLQIKKAAKTMTVITHGFLQYAASGNATYHRMMITIRHIDVGGKEAIGMCHGQLWHRPLNQNKLI